MNKIELIKRNAEEIINESKISKILKKKQPVVYCGYEPSGDIHIGHLVTIMKLNKRDKVVSVAKIIENDDEDEEENDYDESEQPPISDQTVEIPDEPESQPEPSNQPDEKSSEE